VADKDQDIQLVLFTWLRITTMSGSCEHGNELCDC